MNPVTESRIVNLESEVYPRSTVAGNNAVAVLASVVVVAIIVSDSTIACNTVTGADGATDAFANFHC